MNIKDLLHHFNQALYDTNQLIWNEWLKPSLVYIVFGIFLLAFSLVPIMFVDNETFFFVWPVFGILFSSFCLITYLICTKSRSNKPAEPEVVFENEITGFSITKDPKEVVSLGIKESAKQGIYWTGYIVLIVTTAIICVAGWAYLHEINSPSVAITAICPTDYLDTEEGRAAYDTATDDWVKRYLEANPFASLEEVNSARQKSWEEMGCNATSTATVAIADEDLLPCQIHYRDVFMQAKEYGQFEDYPATTTYTGPVATLDEESHPVAKRFYSYHKAALDSGEVDFGGKYAISDWAFTGWGQMFAVVDLETGKVFPFPYAFHESFDYRPDSNLIIINPKRLMPKFDTFGPESDVFCDSWVYEDIKSYYFVFENEQFRLLGPEDTAKLSQPGVLE